MRRLRAVPGVTWVMRVWRFAPRAVRGVRRDVRWLAPSVARKVAAAWRASDPGWYERNLAELAARGESFAPVRDAMTRRREQRRAEFLAAGARLAYEGELYARPVLRGLVLSDLDGRPHLDDFIVTALGLDDWSGESCRVRLTVELLTAEYQPRRRGVAP